MKKSEKAIASFPNFNCCQSVLSAFGTELGLSQQICLKLGSGFGGGMTCGETCGAVTGAYMVLGMKYGHTTNNPEAKARSKQNIQLFNERFVDEQGSLLCKELLGVNIATPQGSDFARENDLFGTRCPAFIRSACRIIEQEF